MKKLLAVLTMALVTTSVTAQIKVGVTLAATGPAASLGIPERNVFALVPKTLAGMPVEVILLDDATDPSAAVALVLRLPYFAEQLLQSTEGR